MVAIGLAIAFVTMVGMGILLVLAAIGIVADVRNVRAAIAAGLPPSLPEARIVIRDAER